MKRIVGEKWIEKFAFLPTRICDNSEKWIWFKKYKERLVDAYWISADGKPPRDGASAFVFERQCGVYHGFVKKYDID